MSLPNFRLPARNTCHFVFEDRFRYLQSSDRSLVASDTGDVPQMAVSVQFAVCMDQAVRAAV